MIMLDLLRHGETELGHTLRGSTDDALTSKGWKIMQQTVNTALDHGLQWDMILSSPLQRCLNFAQERKRFYRELLKIAFLRVIPSQANYFLCEVTSKYASSELATLLLEKYNILIKDCSPKKAFGGKQYIRLAIRNQEDNDRLIAALGELL